jgi:small subunit ribosomal protein S20
MPRKIASKKAIRVTKRRTAHNLSIKLKVRDGVRRVRRAAIAGKKDDAAKHFRDAVSLIDRAAKAHVIPKQRASRLKSRLAHAVAKIGKAPASSPKK